jgi:hypothetical protein
VSVVANLVAFLAAQSGFSGGEVAAIFSARVKIHAAVAVQAAGMLPCLAYLVPMKAKLGQNAGDCCRLLFGKRNPDPFADNLGELKKLRRLALKQGKQLRRVEGTIHFAANEINLYPINLFAVCRAERFGTVLES